MSTVLLMFTICLLVLALGRPGIHDAVCTTGSTKDLEIAKLQCAAANKDPLTMCDSFVDQTQLKWFFVRTVAQ